MSCGARHSLPDWASRPSLISNFLVDVRRAIAIARGNIFRQRRSFRWDFQASTDFPWWKITDDEVRLLGGERRDHMGFGNYRNQPRKMCSS